MVTHYSDQVRKINSTSGFICSFANQKKLVLKQNKKTPPLPIDFNVLSENLINSFKICKERLS